MEFTLPAEIHHLKIVFENTPVRMKENLLSALGLFAHGELLLSVLKILRKTNIKDYDQHVIT